MMRNRIRSGIFAALTLAAVGAACMSPGPQGLFSRAVAQGFALMQVMPGVPTGPSIASTLDSLSGFYFGTNRVGVSGHLEAGLKTALGQPALTSCGTTPALATGSTDTAGTVTLGTTATGCVITFGTAYTAAPTCLVTWIATPLASQSWVTATTAITVTQTSTTNNVIQYFCVAKSGG